MYGVNLRKLLNKKDSEAEIVSKEVRNKMNANFMLSLSIIIGLITWIATDNVLIGTAVMIGIVLFIKIFFEKKK